MFLSWAVEFFHQRKMLDVGNTQLAVALQVEGQVCSHLPCLGAAAVCLRCAWTGIYFLNSSHISLGLCSSLCCCGQAAFVKQTQTEEDNGINWLLGTLLRKLSTGTGHKKKSLGLESTRGDGLIHLWNFLDKSGQMLPANSYVLTFWVTGIYVKKLLFKKHSWWKFW